MAPSSRATDDAPTGLESLCRCRRHPGQAWGCWCRTPFQVVDGSPTFQECNQKQCRQAVQRTDSPPDSYQLNRSSPFLWPSIVLKGLMALHTSLQMKKGPRFQGIGKRAEKSYGKALLIL